MSKPYRPCIVAVIQNDQGWVLAGERADHAGAWQLPQGGIDAGETAHQALFRELKEEIGTDELEVLEVAAGTICYDFPADVQRAGLQHFRGQEQTWFRLRFKTGVAGDLSRSEGEFQALKWMRPVDLLREIITWKQKAYRQGFEALGFRMED